MELRQSKAMQAKNLIKDGVVSHIQSHHRPIVPKAIKQVSRPIIHNEFWDHKPSQGFVIYYVSFEWSRQHVIEASDT